MTTAAEGSSVLTEFAVRDYLRTVPGLLTLLNNDSRRIDLDYSGTGTFLVLYRAGGAPVRGLPMDRAVITFHAYGSSRKAAADLARALNLALLSLAGGPLNGTSYGYLASVESHYWLPTDDGKARYIVSSLVTARLAA